MNNKILLGIFYCNLWIHGIFKSGGVNFLYKLSVRWFFVWIGMVPKLECMSMMYCHICMFLRKCLSLSFCLWWVCWMFNPDDMFVCWFWCVASSCLQNGASYGDEWTVRKTDKGKARWKACTTVARVSFFAFHFILFCTFCKFKINYFCTFVLFSIWKM